ncbi:MAG: helix-turn-helix domain-containing protein [Candidatus Paceibacterota bacterium]
MNNEQPKNLTEIFHEALEFRGLNIEKLSELTNIPEMYLIALHDADFKKLPAAPYVRGYLMKIAEVLRIDGEVLWQTYKNENIKTSGAKDKLPSNRFLIKPFKKRMLIFGFVAILVIIYLVWQIDNLLGIPKIEITNPAFPTVIVNESNLKLSGETDIQNKLTINNEEIFVGEDGRFEKEIYLQPGINTIEFKIKKLLGKEVKVVRQIIYQP